jgi:probable rRNA maturation factor
MTIRLAVEIEDVRWTEALPEAETILERAIAIALADIAQGARPIEVGIRLVDDCTIRGLNRDWRDRDAPTNVLSFPLGDPVPVADPDFPWLLGDIVMSYDTIDLERLRDGKPLTHHVVHLAIHAALHLIGHDHESDEEAMRMETAETSLLAALGIPDPYAARPDILA